MNKTTILTTAYVSLCVQLVIGITTFFAIFIPLQSEDYILTEIMILDTIVQFIELAFYVWLISQFFKLSRDVTYTRYFDWFISTPIMLLTTIYLFEYIRSKDENKVTTITEITNTHWYTIFKILTANLIMLLSGFLAEIGRISRPFAFVTGTIGLLVAFSYIFVYFVTSNLVIQCLFWFMAFVWFLYGIVFLLPYVVKNMSYNFLDIFSKNFYGLFVAVIIFYTSRSYR